MPRSRDPRSYSKEFAIAILRAYNDGEVMLPPLPIALARKRRSEFYSYMQAVKKSPETQESETIQACWQVAFRLEGEFDGTGMAQIVLYNKENTPTAVYLRQALGTKSTAEAADDAAAGVLRKLGLSPEPEQQADPMDKPFDYGQGDEVADPEYTPPPATNKYYTRKPRT